MKKKWLCIKWRFSQTFQSGQALKVTKSLNATVGCSPWPADSVFIWSGARQWLAPRALTVLKTIPGYKRASVHIRTSFLISPTVQSVFLLSSELDFDFQKIKKNLFNILSLWPLQVLKETAAACPDTHGQGGCKDRVQRVSHPEQECWCPRALTALML